MTEKLQNLLNISADYCDAWKLKFNATSALEKISLG
jgi:hypothetical protein